MAGCYLSELSWIEARARLRGDSVVVLPLGAAAKEHGPHLQLDNDRVLAEYLSRRLLPITIIRRSSHTLARPRSGWRRRANS